MIKSSYLSLVYKAGDIASQLDQLYDQKKRGINKQFMIGKGNLPIEIIIQTQENRLRKILEEIQKGYKSSEVEE